MDYEKQLTIAAKDFDIENRENLNTIFSLSNGYLGSKGTLEEDYQNAGTFINGFYEMEEIVYGEKAYGYAKKSQQILKIAGASNLTLEVADQSGKTISKIRDEQQLNLRLGQLERNREYGTVDGDKLTVRSKKIVPIEAQRLVIYECDIYNEGSIKKLSLEFFLGKYHSEKDKDNDDPRVTGDNEHLITYRMKKETPGQVKFTATTQNSQLKVQGMQQRLVLANDVKFVDGKYEDERDTERYQVVVGENESIKVFIITSFSEINQGLGEVVAYDQSVIDSLLKKHYDYYRSFWNKSLVEIDGDASLMKGVNFNIFHLNQAAGRDGKTNIPAKGLTGLGYEGHYFWDTEMYMLPFFIFHDPSTARQLLKYRYSIIESAKKRAQEMAIEEGVLFPWRTINGEECSAYYPAGTAQLHINGDIAYAVCLYYHATNDRQFMVDYGIEILVETARFWSNWGFFSEAKDGKFVINEVTGPDEYTALVNNNYYTNKIAQYNISQAAQWTKYLLDGQLEDSDLVVKLKLNNQEVEKWEKISDNMYFSERTDLNLTEQNDNFFDKDRWNIEETPKEKFPLLLNYHPMTIYKYQVCKQADTLLAHMLFWDQEQLERIENDFNYYDEITTHDSSLSKSVFSIIASRIGNRELAYRYFMDTVLMDLVDIQGNVKDGIHAANMGGSILAVFYGFCGIRVEDGQLLVDPHLPSEIKGLRLNFEYRGSLLRLVLTGEDAEIRLLEGAPVEILYRGSVITVGKK